MRSHYLELNVDSLMKDKKLEANLSMVASRVMAGLNMNGLKYLLPLWLGALTGVTIRCVFAAVAFWLTGCFIKEAAVTRKQRIMLFCLGAFGLYGFMFCYLLGISKTTPVSSAIFNSMQPIWVFLISVFFLHEKATVMKIIGIALGFGGAMLCILTQGSDDLARDAFTGNLLCMISSFVFAVLSDCKQETAGEGRSSDNDEIYIWRSCCFRHNRFVRCRVGCTDVCRSLEGRVALDGVGCTCIYPYFPYLSQLLPGSCRVEVPEDYRCRYLQLSDIGSDHGCLAFFGAGPVQLDTGRCHCYDLYQCVLCGSG